MRGKRIHRYSWLSYPHYSPSQTHSLFTEYYVSIPYSRRGIVQEDGDDYPRVRAATRRRRGPLLAHPARRRVLQEPLPAGRHRTLYGAHDDRVHHGRRVDHDCHRTYLVLPTDPSSVYIMTPQAIVKLDR